MTTLEIHAREHLLARRAQLVDLTRSRREESLIDLLRRVDAALGALDVGEWGKCSVCHDPISPARLANDPLVTVCLECLSEDDRRALERDLEAAARVQRTLLPAPLLRRDGWEVAFAWDPHGVVSGDHVDILQPRGDGMPLHLLLGDVAGKGVAASYLQSHLHALVRVVAAAECSVAELLARTNRFFCEATPAANYATLVVLRLHPDGRVEFGNAGHPRPLLADARGVRPVEGAGVPLGLFCESTYEVRDLQLKAGETLLLYTDGWTEPERDGKEYGAGRAAAVLSRARDLLLPDLIAACRDDLAEFLRGVPRDDDLTLLAARRV
ncbi:MAG TPA: SpoIIE family protein phosphatase [Candidatus Krumholzibacteria bacterium]|nr:SpoIIE family protein phosphatase [Candidatus Krumholzibacteria bacterium]HPD72218.1 SpoIIE family protein phosphatase [Candidatus Krumholzibacteria bacterium]HRY40850.1 SpoIIE family protein phosphatase [Candidatus Krumholzibacteria bacterium]